MSLIDTLHTAQGGQAMVTLARQFAITPAEAEAVVANIVPELARSLERTTLSRGGLSDFVAAMGNDDHRLVVDSATALTSPATRSTGIDLLQEILGNKDQSRAVAGRAARATGLPESIIKSMLPYVVTLIVGALSKQLSGGLGDVLSKLPRKPPSSGGGRAHPSRRQQQGHLRFRCRTARPHRSAAIHTASSPKRCAAAARASMARRSVARSAICWAARWAFAAGV